MTSFLLSMMTFTLVGALSPGPVNLLALAHGIRHRSTTALAFVLGAAASYAGIVGSAGAAAGLLLRHPLLVEAMKWAGAMYLAWLAWKIWAAPLGTLGSGVKTTMPGIGAALAQGVLTQVLNPKAWLVALSGAGLFVLPRTEFEHALALFCAMSFGACLAGVGAWAVAGRFLAAWLQAPGRERQVNRLLGGMLALAVVCVVH